MFLVRIRMRLLVKKEMSKAAATQPRVRQYDAARFSLSILDLDHTAGLAKLTLINMGG